MRAATKIPATIITGFLGAGKTSLIRHLLETARGRRLALIINEFGDLGIDGEIVKGCGIEGCADEDVMELANGCICCTVADDFLPTMEAILARPAPPDHIVIETSGLALPKPLIKAFGWPDVRTRVTVDGVIAVVDAPAVAAGLFASDPKAVGAQRDADTALDHESPLEELFEEQVAAADLIVFNKTDQVGEETLSALVRDLRGALRPGVKVLGAAHGRIDAGLLLGLEAAAEDDLEARPSHHDDGDDHDHDDFESFALDLGEWPDPAALIARLEAVVARHDVIRVKGFAAVAGRPMRLVVQGVGDRFQSYYDRDWNGGEARTTRLVFIGEAGLDRGAVAAAFGPRGGDGDGRG